MGGRSSPQRAHLPVLYWALESEPRKARKLAQTTAQLREPRRELPSKRRARGPKEVPKEVVQRRRVGIQERPPAREEEACGAVSSGTVAWACRSHESW